MASRVLVLEGFWNHLANFIPFLKPREAERSACGHSVFAELELDSSDPGLLFLAFKIQLPGGVPMTRVLGLLGVCMDSRELALVRGNGFLSWSSKLELKLVLVALPLWGVFLPGDTGQMGRC